MSDAAISSTPVNTPLFRDGDLGFVSGITGRRGEVLVSGGFEAEFECVLEKFQALLAQHGLTFKNVCKVNIYLTNMSDRNRMNEMYLEYFGDHLPARTVVCVSSIVRNGSVEMEATVRIPS